MPNPANPPLPWWRGASLYQVYPRSFADSNGDGIGDLAGITARLDYIAALGVDGVWISPFFPSPMRDFGYDVSDYRGVDPMFGTLADFDALIERAHALGLKVVIDQVWSHTAAEHPWFEESRQSRDNPKADWYVWADAKPDGSPPNNWLSWMGGPAWRWEPRRKQYHLHNFLPQMPDLNFHCPAVQDEILAVARFWLERGVDGFRLDTANLYFHSRGLENNPPSNTGADMPVLMQTHQHNTDQPEALAFFERLRPMLDEFGAEGGRAPGRSQAGPHPRGGSPAVPGRRGARFTVGEIGGAEPLKTMAEYTGGTRRLHTAYSFAMLGDRPTPAVIAGHMRDWQQGAAAAAWPSWAFSNHDVPRVASRWGGSSDGGFAFGGQAHAHADNGGSPALWLALLTMLRGTLFIYQGEELGLTQAEVPFEFIQDPFGLANWPTHKGRDGCRTPMPWQADAVNAGFSTASPWLPIPPEHLALAVDRQQPDPGSTLALTRQLLALRRSHPALQTGAFETLLADDTLLVLRRTVDDDRVVAAFNLSAAARELDWPHDAPVVVSVGSAQVQGQTLKLGAWSAFITAQSA